MCRPTRCAGCEKTTWAGCGMHVDQVMAGVAARDRCSCDPGSSSSARSSRSSILSRMRGR